jgi:hypothetical protein
MFENGENRMTFTSYESSMMTVITRSSGAVRLIVDGDRQ